MLGASVRGVRRSGDGLAVDDGGRHRAVRPTSSSPPTPTVAADLCPGLTAAEADAPRAACSYMGIVCASLVLRRPLAPYYLTYITDPATPFTAVVEMSSFVDPAELGGRTWCTCRSTWRPTTRSSMRATTRSAPRSCPACTRCTRSSRADDVLAFRVSTGASRVRRAEPRVLGPDAEDDDVGTGPVHPGIGPAPLRHPQRERYARVGGQLHERAPRMKPLASLSLDLDNLWAVPDDPRRRGLGRLPTRTSTPLVPTRPRRARRAAPADHVLRRRPGRRPRPEREGHLRPRRGRPRDRQPLVPPPALAAPLLAGGDRRPSWPGPRTPSRP